MRVVAFALFAILAGGCAMAPGERLSFPQTPTAVDAAATWYDTDRDGRPDFATARDAAGRVDRLLYDDDGGGTPDRVYRLADYADADVPHVVILLDSIPYQTAVDYYAAGGLRWFGPPQKMVAPFPSLTEVCYTEVLDSPPLATVIDTQYDPRVGAKRSDVWRRVGGYVQPWERRLTYESAFYEQGLSFLDPQKWCAAEFARAKRAIDDAPRKTSVVYVASAASLVCKFGRPGADEVLRGAERLCLQLLHERQGAVKISMMADHGHNYTPSKNVTADALLGADGFRVADTLERPGDVVPSFNGLVTCGLLHTREPAGVAARVVRHEAVDVAAYVDGDRVVVLGKRGRAAVERRGTRTRYVPLDGDPLGYAAVTQAMRAAGTADADGFADDAAWFAATLDHEWPDAAARLWHAFHRQTVQPPTVMLSLKDGFYLGKPEYEKFIAMRSTHGGLNQANSATFVMTTTGRLDGPVSHRDVLRRLCPDAWPPAVVR